MPVKGEVTRIRVVKQSCLAKAGLGQAAFTLG